MNLYIISQNKNKGYDTYDSAVVAAENEIKARLTYPGQSDYVSARLMHNHNQNTFIEGKWRYGDNFEFEASEWAEPEHVQVQLIGVAVKGTEAGVICASYNAG